MRGLQRGGDRDGDEIAVNSLFVKNHRQRVCTPSEQGYCDEVYETSSIATHIVRHF